MTKQKISQILAFTLFSLLLSASSIFALEDGTTLPNSYVGTTKTTEDNRDYLQLYRQLKQKQFERDMQLKSDIIGQQRKSCAQNVQSYQKSRQKQQVELRKSCYPVESATSSALRKPLIEACKQKMQAFELETKSATIQMRLRCKDLEKKVLGLTDLM